MDEIGMFLKPYDARLFHTYHLPQPPKEKKTRRTLNERLRALRHWMLRTCCCCLLLEEEDKEEEEEAKEEKTEEKEEEEEIG